MSTLKPIYSISISAQATLDMHSLNNEGGEGNQIQTRMVNIIGADGRLHNVNAISGDMFKHIQAEHLHRLAIAKGLPLSEGARYFNANRVNYDIDKPNELIDFLNQAKNSTQELDVILQHCAITDLEGILVTAGKRSLPRKSVVEFGWVVGIPEQVETDTYFHVKYSSDRSATAQAKAETDEGREANIGQAIFHRPASSGIYAVVLNLETSRIGFNDISQTYAVDEIERAKRLQTLLESVLCTFVEPSGAMRSTQNPHYVNFSGIVATSYNVLPAPCISPIKPEYRKEISAVAAAFNKLYPEAIEIKPFDTLGDFTEIFVDLIQSAIPYKFQIAS